MKGPLRILPLLFMLAACGEKDTQQPPPAPAPVLDDQAAGVSGDNAYAHCAAICALGPRHSGSPAYAEQIAYLRRHLEKAGWTVVERGFKLTDGSVMTNLYATFGAGTQPRPLLLSCHIDTKRLPGGFIGADDGASAAALLVELARVLARTPHTAGDIELAFFDGEESFSGRMTMENSLFGSRFDVLRRQANNSLPRWQINLDMVGGRNKMIAVPVLDTPTEMLDHYLRAIEGLGYPETEWTLYPGTYLDDHRPFADAGVASLNLIASFADSTWWHTPKDNMSRISRKSLEESGHVVLRLVGQLCGAGESRPAGLRGEGEEQERPARENHLDGNDGAQ